MNVTVRTLAAAHAHALSALMSATPVMSADPWGKFVVMDSFVEGSEVPPWVLHLTLEDGYAGFTAILPEPHSKSDCDADGPRKWSVPEAFVLFTSSDESGVLRVNHVSDDRRRVIVSRDTDAEQIVKPIVEFIGGARFVARDEGASFVKEDQHVDLLSLDLREAQQAMVLSQMATPRDGALTRCYARQLAKLEPVRADHVEMLQIARIAGLLGEMRVTPAFWRGVPLRAAQGRDVDLQDQIIRVLDAMIVAPHGGETTTAEALYEAETAEPAIAASLSEDGRIISSRFVAKHGDDLLALRRYANWLVTDMSPLSDGQRRERLCHSFLMGR